MTSSYALARLIGPTLVMLSLTETKNARIWASNTAAGVYFNGCVLFVSGLGIVQNHNLWQLQWPVFITLVGWGAMALGLQRMFAPERALEAAKQMSKTQLIATSALLLPIGSYLITKGFF